MESTRKNFNVIRQLSWDELDMLEKIIITPTMHSHIHRVDRYDAYEGMGLLSQEFLDGFLVDKGHVNGPEYHCINVNGIIYIFNERSLRLITVEGARGGQLKRYYTGLNVKPDDDMLELIATAYERLITNPIHNL